MAQELEVDSDLVSAACEWLAPHHTGVAIVAQSLEHCLTGLAPSIHAAYPYLVRYHQDGLLADHFLSGELPLHPAHVLLLQLHRGGKREKVSTKPKLMKFRPNTVMRNVSVSDRRGFKRQLQHLPAA